MKQSLLLVSVLVFVGAGCSTTNVTNTTIQSKPAKEVPAQVTSTVTTDSSSTSNSETSDNTIKKEEKSGVDTPTSAGVQKVHDFTITGKNISYDLKEMKVKKGDKVRVTFKNAEGFHDWKLEGYNVGTKQMPAGQSETVEFTADKVGTFEFYCSVGKHRQMGMKGNFIVEE